MSDDELLMLRCMVEYIDEISGNDYVYAQTNAESVSIKDCQQWLEKEMRHSNER